MGLGAPRRHLLAQRRRRPACERKPLDQAPARNEPHDNEDTGGNEQKIDEAPQRMACQQTEQPDDDEKDSDSLEHVAPSISGG